MIKKNVTKYLAEDNVFWQDFFERMPIKLGIWDLNFCLSPLEQARLIVRILNNKN